MMLPVAYTKEKKEKERTTPHPCLGAMTL